MLALLMREVNDGDGVRGWLAVLCVVLLGYHPLSFALAAGTWLSAVAVRGTPLALILVCRLAVTGVGVAAGLALVGGRPAAATIALVAMALSGAMDTFIYLTSYVPNNRVPGDTPYYLAASLVYHAAWIGYLLRSKRVRTMSG